MHGKRRPFPHSPFFHVDILADELQVETHMTSLVHDLLSPIGTDLTPRGTALDSLLDSPPSVGGPVNMSRAAGGRKAREKEASSRILHMLQNSASASSRNATNAGKSEWFYELMRVELFMCR